MLRLAIFACLAVYAAAQSAPCKAALKNIYDNNDAHQCLALTDLVPVVTADPSTSIVQPLDCWLVKLCAAPSCSNDTIAAVVTNLVAGCSTEFNISSDATTLIPIVQSVYPTVRKTLCLKHGSTLCVTETLTNVETVTGPLTLANSLKVFHNPPTSLPAKIICTDCTKAAYSIWANDLPSIAATVKPVLESKCGASFVDGSSPSDIT